MTNAIAPGTTSAWRPRTAMVLAAGLGTRMRPLTDTIPKPLVALNGRALLDRVLDRLAEAGVRTAVVNVHYLPDLIERHLASRTTPRIAISDERGVLLDTGGGVMKARAHLGDEPFLVHNSDTVWIEHGVRNLDRLAAAWNGERMDALLLLADRATCLGYDGAGDFDLAADGRLMRRATGSSVPYVFAGVSINHPRILEGAPAGAFSLNVLWDRAIARGRLAGLVLEGTWMHVGTPQAVRDAEALMARLGAC